MSDIAALAKLGKTLTDLTSKVIGPWATSRQADSDAQAEIQQALAERVADYIDSSPASPAVVDALMSCGGKTNLINLARIVQKTQGQLNEDADPSRVDDDWAANFKDKARTCSNEEMADLWAQLLAAEANNPGSYSKKTVNALADLEPDDARLFRGLADFRLLPLHPVYLGNTLLGLERSPSPALMVILDEKQSIYTDRRISFSSLSRLDWLGLVGFNPRGYQINLDSSTVNAYKCGSEVLFLSGDKPAAFGRVTFTPAGAQLAELCTPVHPPNGFSNYLIDTWRGQGIRVARSIEEAEAQITQGQDGK